MLICLSSRRKHLFSSCWKFAVAWTLLSATTYAQLRCLTGGTWIEGLQACMYQNVATESSTSVTLWSSGTVIPRNQDEILKFKVHVRLTANSNAEAIPRLLFLVERGGVSIVNASIIQEARSSDAAEYSFTFPRRVLQQGNLVNISRVDLDIQMSSYYVGYYVHYTALFHVYNNSTRLSTQDAISLEVAVAECCPTRPVFSSTELHWCARWRLLTGSFVPNFCDLPETLCDRNGSLLKLVFPGGFNCSNTTAARVFSSASLTSLAWLDLSFSSLKVPLHDLAFLTTRKSLQWLILRDAGLTGALQEVAASPTPGSSLPPDGDVACDELAPLGRRLLVLSGNNLTGRVPNCLASHPTLEELKLDRNSLTSLPSNWSCAVSMVDMDVSSNPALVGPLTSLPPSLTRLNVSFTALGGGLPAPLPLRLIAADFERARLSGRLNTPSVWELHVNASSTASRSGSRVGSIGSIGSALALLSLSNNALEGELPELLPPALRFFILDNNKLNGTLPVLPPNLTYFSCAHNHFSGTLIQGQPPNARVLDFSDNEFSGALPPSLAQLPALTCLNVSRNKLYGSIEPFTSQLTSGNVLLGLDLSFNFFSGSLPSSLGQLAALQSNKSSASPRRLDISYNSFTGTVPSYIYEILPFAIISCQCIAVVAEGNHFTCPVRETITSDEYLFILQKYLYLPCFDSDCRYNLGQWLAGGPPVGCHAMLPQALRSLSLEQITALDGDMSMRGSGRGTNTNMETVTIGDFNISLGEQRNGSNRWPLINVLTVLLAALCGLFALVALFFFGVVWASRTFVRWRFRRSLWRSLSQLHRQLRRRLQSQPRQRWLFWRRGLERQAPPPPPPPQQQQHEDEANEVEQRQQQEGEHPEVDEGGSAVVRGERRIRSGGGAGGVEDGSVGNGHVGLVLAANSTDAVLPGDLELAFWHPTADGGTTGAARPPSEVEPSAWTAADAARGSTAAAPAAVVTTEALRAATAAAPFSSMDSEGVPSNQVVRTSGSGIGEGRGSRRQQTRARSGNSVPWFDISGVSAAATAAASPYHSGRSVARLAEVCVVVASEAEAAASSSSSRPWSLRTARQSNHGGNSRWLTSMTTTPPPLPPAQRPEAALPPLPPPAPPQPAPQAQAPTSPRASLPLTQPLAQQPTLLLPPHTPPQQQTSLTQSPADATASSATNSTAATTN